jgi:hypothetical protein
VTTSDRWNELQARWAAGEPLSPEEERERLDGAHTGELAARELAMFEVLRASAEGVEELPRGLVDKVLTAVGARPRLFLLGPGERPPATERAPKLRRAAVAAAIVVPLAAAAATALVLRERPEPAPSDPVARLTPPPLARSELVLASGEVTAPGDARVGGRPLAAGDSVSTGNGRACLGIDPGIDVCLGGDSEVVVDSLRADDIRIRIERGTALAALDKREAGHTFALTAGNIAVKARGTVFAVERQAADRLDVVVMEGAVEVSQSAEPEAIVSAHSRLTVRRGSERGAAEAIGRGEEARFWALLAARGLWAKPELGVLEVRTGDPGLEIAVDREAPLTLPFHAFVPAGRRSLSLRTATGDELTSSVDVVAGETLVVDPRDLLARRALLDEAAAVPSAASLLSRARNELAAGNARAALGVYERLRATYPTSPEARTVLVTIGKLELDLKQPARALKSFDAYLAAPGPLAPEALAGRIRALRALGRTADERRAIETYLSRHPDGFESPLLRQRLEVLQGR